MGPNKQQASRILVRIGVVIPVALLAVGLFAPAVAASGPGLSAIYKWTSMDVPCGPHPIAFEDGSTEGAHPIVDWRWEFGDGATSAAQHPQHTFPDAGAYPVRLTVTDSAGGFSTVTITVDVSLPEAPCDTREGGSEAGAPPGPRDGVDADADGDRDGDGVRNADDNCPLRSNAGQADADQDGVGDVCDPDLDADGISNLADNCPLIANAGQSDRDGNGVGDVCDRLASLGPVVFLGPVGGTAGNGGPGSGDGGAGAPVVEARGAGAARIGTTDVATASSIAVAGAAGVAVTFLLARDLLQRRARRVASGLGAGGLVGLFSRISGDELLESKARQNIIASIREQPGIHFRALQRAVGVGSSSVQYHLNVLVKAGYVHRHEWKGAVGYYAEGTAVMPAHETVRSETARQILGDIVTHPASTVRDVADRLSCDPSLVSYHLRQFQGAGLIDRVTQAGAQRIVPRPDAALALGHSMPQMLAPQMAA